MVSRAPLWLWLYIRLDRERVLWIRIEVLFHNMPDWGRWSELKGISVLANEKLSYYSHKHDNVLSSYVPGGPIKTGPLYFFFRIFRKRQKKTKDIYKIFCIHQGQCILNMAICTRFSSNFIWYSGAIWRILTTIITVGLYSRSTAQIKMQNNFKFKAVIDYS